MIGDRYGLLTIVRQAPSSTKAGKRQWVCRCDCGGEAVTTTGSLRSGNTRSCGCLKHRAYRPSPVAVGDRYGRLLVEAREGSDKFGNRLWRCRCDCGKTVRVSSTRLAKGDTLSCGCYARDMVIARSTKHGLHGTPEYRSWQAMQSRCTNPKMHNFMRYGGRGITVCDRWCGEQGFATFLADMGERPEGTTIDRVDVNGNYEPGNCRWATPKEQRANQRPKSR